MRVSAEKLSGILDYAPDDLYITVGAGTPLTEIQQFLARENQQLAMASPWPDATIGGLVAANVNAPLRMRYGAVRDLVLCATVALADGRVIRTGRPIVKNVAGYDLTKAFVGSYGTLGVLTDLSLKIAARPRACRTVLVPLDELAPGLELGQQLLAVALNASAIVLYHGYRDRAAGLPESRYVLAYTVEGLIEDVQAELEQVHERLHVAGCSTFQEVDQVTGTAIWSRLAGLGADDSSLLVRAGVPVKDVAEYVMVQSSRLTDDAWLADMASGHVYVVRRVSTGGVAVSSWLQALRTSAQALGGYAMVMDMPGVASSLDRLDRWGYRPEGLKLMQRLKARWDPQGILNPGVFLVDW
jgi:D-lactate dehydrogenase (cytochrome)